MSCNKDKVKTYFITGTGRCGSMLLSKILNLSQSTSCVHEKYFQHSSMVDYYENNDLTGFESDIDNDFESARTKLGNKKLGVSSGHLYFAIPLLWEIYRSNARFILLIRRPDEFVRSAIARGFFDPDHPHYCNQLSPKPDDPIAPRWQEASVLERNLWYWRLVNNYVLNIFDHIPKAFWRVIRIEDLNSDIVLDTCNFLGVEDIDRADIEQLLNRRINSSPGLPGVLEENPYSIPIVTPTSEQWNDEEHKLLSSYTTDLSERIYA